MLKHCRFSIYWWIWWVSKVLWLVCVCVLLFFFLSACQVFLSCVVHKKWMIGSSICKLLNEPPHDKTNKMSVRPTKTQISLGIRPVWSEFSLCAQWVAEDPSFLHADNEDSDQTGRMPRLIWVFAGRTVILLVLSRGGCNVLSFLSVQILKRSVHKHDFNII